MILTKALPLAFLVAATLLTKEPVTGREVICDPKKGHDCGTMDSFADECWLTGGDDPLCMDDGVCSCTYPDPPSSSNVDQGGDDRDGMKSNEGEDGTETGYFPTQAFNFAFKSFIPGPKEHKKIPPPDRRVPGERRRLRLGHPQVPASRFH